MISQQLRDFYSSHSVTSNPGPLASMLDGLPTKTDELIDAIGGFLLHITTASELLGEPEPADRGAGELTMTKVLQQIAATDPAPLHIARPPERRLRVNCRGFAMMFVTILRHRGIPARKRVGFDWAGWIHEIAEYWDERRRRWVLVDPDPATREPLRNFLARTRPQDQHESPAETIKAGEAFHPGGLAWHRCRSGRTDADDYRVIDLPGMTGVRVALIQDLDSLNKVELRSFDEWHELITAPCDKLNDRSLAWLDRAAALTGDSEARFDEMRSFYVHSSYGAAVQTRLAELVGPPGPTAQHGNS